MDSPPKINKLMETIRKCVEEGRYLDTRHATQRQAERSITRPEYLHALLNGYHEKRKDKFEEIYNSWNYSIRGKTIDARVLRIVVSFDENNMLIITAIDLSKT
jgi:hypothetical protein